ncbi:MAG: hydantoinase/oxoprolinase family protein, partial [Gaiellales bacterium]
GTRGGARPLAGGRARDRARAEAAIRDDVAEPLGLSVEEAALAVLRILNANMANAVRVMSVARGRDPRDFALVAIGGAGPMHGCQLADEVGIPRVVVPRHPGVAAAWGLLATDIAHDLRRSWRRPIRDADPAELDAAMAELEGEARALLALSESVALGEDLRWEADVRYRGQAYNLTVPLGARPAGPGTLVDVEAAFAAEHERLYDYTPAVTEAEIVTLRLRAVARTAPARPDAAVGTPRPAATQRVYDGAWSDWPVLDRAGLAPDQPLDGPAIIEQEDTTTVLQRGWRAVARDDGSLILERR